MTDNLFPDKLVLELTKLPIALRYGENPHQQGAVYKIAGETSWVEGVVDHSIGLQLGYLNLNDADAAWRLVHVLNRLGDRPSVSIIKHANPSGVSVADDLATAYRNTYEADPLSAFGGIVALNRPVDQDTVEAMVEAAQADVVIAPGYEPGTIEALQKRRKNTRILEASPPGNSPLHFRTIDGALLVQEAPSIKAWRPDWKVVTERQPTEEEWANAEFAWIVTAYTKSNAVVVTKDGVCWGVGAGQQNRRDSARLATEKAAGRAAGGAAATDAFYVAQDAFDASVESGATVVIQPGGSQLGDEIVIKRANELNVAMIFTGERQFNH